jgi:Phage tail assembly chaperone protein, TAC
MLEQSGARTVEKEIDGEVYKFVYMTTSQALEAYDKLKRVFSPVVDKFPKLDGDAKLAPLVLEFLLKGVVALEGKELAKLCKETVMPFVFKGEGEASMLRGFDTEFAGKLDVLVRIVLAFIEVQYGSFSKLLPSGTVERLKEAVQKAQSLAAATQGK